MIKSILLFVFLSICSLFTIAQTNISSSNLLAEQVLLGNFNPSDFAPDFPVEDPHTVSALINSLIIPDSLRNNMLHLQTFQNRNTASDTLSNSTGIGAARRWVYAVFQNISQQNKNRLIPSYLQFNNTVCNTPGLYKNIYAVLPGSDPGNHSVVLIEGHMDSRCEDVCDINCIAYGMEDNATGTALVLELARVMSAFQFKSTIVFMVTVGEEQGLLGAEAFAKYAVQKGINLRAVLNNDVIGGIICGQTSSPPGCPGLNTIDSTHVRIFSYNKNYSPHKGLARYIKLQYEEELRPYVNVPMDILIMNAEDRTGRGGDHIPFRQQGFSAVRFTSANEHGDANPVNGYSDRQHSTRDILGEDTNQDGITDSFYVDFNYLARNTAINGIAAAMSAYNVPTPTFTLDNTSEGITVNILPGLTNNHYRIGIRTKSNDFNELYDLKDSLSFHLPGVQKDTLYFISVCAVDSNGIEGMFAIEKLAKSVLGIQSPENKLPLELIAAYPNPADETTTFSILVNESMNYKKASIQVMDSNGRKVAELPFRLEKGMNEVIYDHGYNMSGIYYYSLFIDGQLVARKSIVFTN